MDGEVLLWLLLAAVGILFNPVTWAIVIVVIVAKSTSKKNATARQTRPMANGGTRKVAPPKPTDPMAKWNWLLYIGSFLIVLAMMYFIDAINDSYVAPSTIFLTILIYTGGIVLHKTISYLRPVAKAFVYSALCMIPLWMIAFSSMGMPSEIVPVCVSSAFMAATFVAAFLLDDNLMGHIAFASVVVFLWSFSSLTSIRQNTGVFEYLMLMSPMIAAAFPASLYLSGAALPNAFKESAKNIGIVLWPLTFGLSLILLVIPNIASTAPLLRTVCALLFLAYSLAFWYKTRKRLFVIFMRVGIQALIITLVADLMEFSIGFILNDTIIIRKAVCFVTAWLITFAAQVLYSLYCKKETKNDEVAERIISIASMVCIFCAPCLCLGLPSTEAAIIWMIVCLLLAVFGVAYATHYKNVSWSIATAASVMILPFVIGNYMVTPTWKGGPYMICYGIISLLFLLGAYFLQRIQKKETQMIGAISISASCFVMTMASMDASLAYLGYILSAIFFAGYALLVNINAFYEVAIYTFGLGLISLTNDILASPGSYYRDDTHALLRQVFCIHIVGATFIGAQLLSKYLYRKKDHARFIIGYSIFSVMMTFICASITKSVDIGWALLFLVEQVVALLYSVIKKEKWLTWFSSIEIFIIALRLTDGMYFLWLGLIGVGLITIVIWQLSKANKKMSSQTTTPTAPRATEETEPAKAPDTASEKK
jgi:hypothetical protein